MANNRPLIGRGVPIVLPRMRTLTLACFMALFWEEAKNRRSCGNIAELESLLILKYIIYEGCSLILVIDSFSPKSSSLPEENYLVVINRFFAALKSPNDFKIIQLIMAN